MIISDKREVATVNFKDLEYGECFIHPEDESICMKVYGSSEYNEVELSTGNLFKSYDNTEVIKVNSRLEVW